MAKEVETAWDAGRRHASRDDGSFSYRNAVIVEHLGKAGGCLIGYGTPDRPGTIPTDMPKMFVPLQKLENLAPRQNPGEDWVLLTKDF